MPLASLLCEIPASNRAALILAATFRSTWVAAFRRSRGACVPKGLSVALCVAAGDIPKGAFGRKFEPLGLDPAPSRASVRKRAPANFQKGDDQVHSSPRFSPLLKHQNVFPTLSGSRTVLGSLRCGSILVQSARLIGKRYWLPTQATIRRLMRLVTGGGPYLRRFR